jgi:hypothetical protein
MKRNDGKRDQEHDFWVEVPEKKSTSSGRNDSKVSGNRSAESESMEFRLIISETPFLDDDRLAGSEKLT